MKIRAGAAEDLKQLKASYERFAGKDREWESQRRSLGFRLSSWVAREAEAMLEKEVTVGGEDITYGKLMDGMGGWMDGWMG